MKLAKPCYGVTLKVNYREKEESIRLIGIDTPESRPNKKAKMDALRSGELPSHRKKYLWKDFIVWQWAKL